MATGRVVPFPVEDPEHLRAVFVSVSVVRFVVVPVGVGWQMTISVPEPVLRRHTTLTRHAHPEIAVLGRYKHPTPVSVARSCRLHRRRHNHHHHSSSSSFEFI